MQFFLGTGTVCKTPMMAIFKFFLLMIMSISALAADKSCPTTLELIDLQIRYRQAWTKWKAAVSSQNPRDHVILVPRLRAELDHVLFEILKKGGDNDTEGDSSKF